MASSDALINFMNQFPVVMPGMVDPTFLGTIAYMCKHNERSVPGLVISCPINIDLVTLFDKIDFRFETHPLVGQPVYYGGPVQTERGFVLYDATDAHLLSLVVPNGLETTTSKDVLEAVAQGGGPHRSILTLGYAGWSAGRLEDGTSRNGWLIVQTDPGIIFNVSPEVRFAAALNLLGTNPAVLSGEVRYA